jgi:hypothetical protein
MAKEISYVNHLTNNNSEYLHRNNPIDVFRKKNSYKNETYSQKKMDFKDQNDPYDINSSNYMQENEHINSTLADKFINEHKPMPSWDISSPMNSVSSNSVSFNEPRQLDRSFQTEHPNVKKSFQNNASSYQYTEMQNSTFADDSQKSNYLEDLRMHVKSSDGHYGIRGRNTYDNDKRTDKYMNNSLNTFDINKYMEPKKQNNKSYLSSIEKTKIYNQMNDFSHKKSDKVSPNNRFAILGSY